MLSLFRVAAASKFHHFVIAGISVAVVVTTASALVAGDIVIFLFPSFFVLSMCFHLSEQLIC